MTPTCSPGMSSCGRKIMCRYRHQGRGSVIRRNACWLLRFEVDCEELHMVMVDFEMVDFEEPDTSFSKRAVQREHIKKKKSMYLRRWLESKVNLPSIRYIKLHL